MRLPSLTYALTLTTRCASDWKPVSVSINVADSTKSFGTDDLQVGETLSFDLQIPSNQIGPLTLEQFCVRSEQAEADSILTIPSVLSAQASLRCATGSAESIRYVTVPLDVLLECVDSPPSND
jgi:hypothetical protein